MLKSKNKLPKQDKSKLQPAGYKKYLVILIFAAIGFLTIPDLLLWPQRGVDNSWAVGLNLAIIRGMQFGKDVVFTFGPLGFMYTPLFCQFNTWLISAAFTLFVHLLLIYSILLMMKKLLAGLTDYILMGITLIFALPIMSVEYRLLFSVSILLYLSIVKPPARNRLLMLCVFVSFLMAAASLIKFTAMMISAGILLFMTIFYLYKKQIMPLCYMLLAYIASILVLLDITGQKITNFPIYLLNSYELSDGYNYAMMIIQQDQPGDIYVGLCVVAMVIFLLLNSIIKNKPTLMYFILINLVYIFVSFKHGFVRHDNFHIRIFFANALLILSSIYITHKKQFNLLLRCLLPIIIYVLIMAIFERSGRSMIIPDPPQKLKMVGSVFSLLTDDTAGRNQKLQDVKREVRRSYSAQSKTIKYIDNLTTAIIPCEISIAFAYNLNWDPYPVFQSYSAYTDKLDMLNSQFFESTDAPEVLIYTLGSFTTRYSIFDMPATFRTILKNYRLAFMDGDCMILRKINVFSSPPPKTISVLDTEFGKSVPVPKIEDGYLFAKIYMDYNLLGKIAKLLYKPSAVTIEITADQYEVQHRFIFSTARNGIFLSQYVRSVNELPDIWNGKLNNNLKSFTILSQNRYFYNKHIRVEFFEVPK